MAPSNAPHKCCVLGCTDKTSTRHSFPVYEEEVYNEWLRRINNSVLSTLHPLIVYKKYRVCGRHFIEKCRLVTTKRLMIYSLPTLYLPDYNEDPSEENSFLYPKLELTKKASDVNVASPCGSSEPSTSSSEMDILLNTPLTRNTRVTDVPAPVIKNVILPACTSQGLVPNPMPTTPAVESSQTLITEEKLQTRMKRITNLKTIKAELHSLQTTTPPTSSVSLSSSLAADKKLEAILNQLATLKAQVAELNSQQAATLQTTLSGPLVTDKKLQESRNQPTTVKAQEAELHSLQVKELTLRIEVAKIQLAREVERSLHEKELHKMKVVEYHRREEQDRWVAEYRIRLMEKNITKSIKWKAPRIPHISKTRHCNTTTRKITR